MKSLFKTNIVFFVDKFKLFASVSSSNYHIWCVSGVAEIDRESLQTMGVVAARLNKRDLGSVMKDIKSKLSAIHLPPAYQITYGGPVYVFMFRKLKLSSLKDSFRFSQYYCTINYLKFITMKNLFLLIAIAAIFSISACAQSGKSVPAKVKTAFHQKFPKAKKVEWGRENTKEWEAEFKMNGKDYSANYDNKGNWLETEFEIKMPDIPAAVKTTLSNEFSGFKVKEPELSETKKSEVYEFELKKGETHMDVAIAPNGKVVTKETKKENDEEGDND